MPACYAHHRFGREAAKTLPAEVQLCIRQFQRLYDAGLQGPDIFFYHNILFRDKTVSLGKKCHDEGGEEFFAHARFQLTPANGEAAQAYLWGVLAHFCLDSVMHPYVLEQVASGEFSHVELETEFDRFLMRRNGIRQPFCYNRVKHLRLTDGECITAALFYSANPRAVRRSVRSMAFLGKVMATPQGTRREIVELFAGKKLQQHFIDRTANKKCESLNPAMLELYQQALALLPEMVAQVQAYIASGEPLGELFENTFNG